MRKENTEQRREQVREAYVRLGGNISAMSRELGLHRSTVRLHMRKMDLGKKPLASGHVTGTKEFSAELS